MKGAARGTERKRIRMLFLPLVSVAFCLSPKAQPDQLRPLEELLKPEKLEDYRADEYHDRIEILRKAIEQNAKGMEVHWKRGRFQEAKERLKDIGSLCGYALLDSHQEEDPKELSDKEVKKLEIVARRLFPRLQELKRSLPFPEQALFDSVIQELEQLREQLLKQLFGDNVVGE